MAHEDAESSRLGPLIPELVPVPLATRVLVADDHRIVRAGLRRVLDGQPDFEVAAETADGAEAVERPLRDDVDLAIIDVSMPRSTGIGLPPS
jgi:DNA-binding NarL/FixJ family response regulator